MPNGSSDPIGEAQFRENEKVKAFNARPNVPPGPDTSSCLGVACQECGKRGGQTLSYTQGAFTLSRWCCPHCLDVLRDKLKTIELPLKDVPVPSMRMPPEIADSLPPTPAKSAHNWINKALETSKKYPEEQRSYARGYRFEGEYGQQIFLLVEECGRDGRVVLKIEQDGGLEVRQIILSPQQWRELRGLYLTGASGGSTLPNPPRGGA